MELIPVAAEPLSPSTDQSTRNPQNSEPLIPAGLLMWLASGRRGMSSNAIVQHLTGVPAAKNDSYLSYPYDPDDLGRCLKLLAAVPLLRVMLPGMATASPEWAALIANWEAIEASYVDEAARGWPQGSSPTYDLMRSVLDPLRNARMKATS